MYILFDTSQGNLRVALKCNGVVNTVDVTSSSLFFFKSSLFLRDLTIATIRHDYDRLTVHTHIDASLNMATIYIHSRREACPP